MYLAQCGVGFMTMSNMQNNRQEGVNSRGHERNKLQARFIVRNRGPTAFLRQAFGRGLCGRPVARRRWLSSPRTVLAKLHWHVYRDSIRWMKLG